MLMLITIQNKISTKLKREPTTSIIKNKHSSYLLNFASHKTKAIVVVCLYYTFRNILDLNIDMKCKMTNYNIS